MIKIIFHRTDTLLCLCEVLIIYERYLMINICINKKTSILKSVQSMSHFLRYYCCISEELENIHNTES